MKISTTGRLRYAQHVISSFNRIEFPMMTSLHKDIKCWVWWLDAEMSSTGNRDCLIRPNGVTDRYVPGAAVSVDSHEISLYTVGWLPLS